MSLPCLFVSLYIPPLELSEDVYRLRDRPLYLLRVKAYVPLRGTDRTMLKEDLRYADVVAGVLIYPRGKGLSEGVRGDVLKVKVLRRILYR